MLSNLLCIEWENDKHPGVKHHGPPLYLKEHSKPKNAEPMDRENAIALAKRADNNFKGGKHRVVYFKSKSPVTLKKYRVTGR